MRGAQCPVCYSTDIVPFLEILQVPVHCNLLWTTREEAVRATRGDIQLGFCTNCGHIFNLAFQPELMEYSQDYENSLFGSSHFRKYIKDLAEELIERYDLHGKQIIEIGSGRGDFLKLICELGGNRGLGFDPGYIPDQHANLVSKQVVFIQDFYSKKYCSYEADFICCRHVLEHLQAPNELLITVAQAIKNRRDAVIFFEVPNVLFTLEDLGIWDLIYEHCSYFSACSLSWLFMSLGFHTLNVYCAYSNQFLCVEGKLDESPRISALVSRANIRKLEKAVESFSIKYRDELERWQQILRRKAEQSKKVVIWGAGSKGVTFLNALEVGDEIDYVVDINPRKQGKFIAGTGQQIVSPLFLRDYQPDIVVIMNSIYGDEIKGYVNDLGIFPEYLFACR